METSQKISKKASAIYFENALQKAGLSEKEAQRKFNTLAIARLIVFVGIIASAWTWNKTGDALWSACLFFLTVIFFVLMKRQQAARRERDFQRNLQTVNNDELERLSYRFKRADTGVQYQEKNHGYAADLDIFGDYSLYRLLNRTRTAEGSRRLSAWLKSQAPLDEILMRQEASEEFKKHPEMRQQWEAIALLHEHAAQQVGAFRSWAAETMPEEFHKSLKWRFWPVITALIIALVLAKLIPAWVLVLSLAWHFIILKRFSNAIQSITNRTTALGFTLTAYSELLETAESAPYHSRWWMERKATIKGSAKALKQAGSLFEKLDYRNNPFFFLFIGIPSLCDLHCLTALGKWKQMYHADLNSWLEVLADTEAMNSISGHAFANQEYTLPQVTWQNGVYVEAITMGHPLIPDEKRISNDFRMEGMGQTMLVTGSNMSGKSTFLRTIGLNIVLAQIGAVVSAEKFACSPVRVFSSMRTQDSLEENTSSFYAELKRLRQLLEMADEANQAPVFYLLDEILKGTNSADRHRGAEALIRQLHPKRSAGLVSTHDLELGEWGAKENYVQNVHFRSDVRDGKLYFDYTLHPGICRSFNASELMKMMGIDIDMTKDIV
jgi:ABC-type multidrug transport system fused ATPase/permease subunit